MSSIASAYNRASGRSKRRRCFGGRGSGREGERGDLTGSNSSLSSACSHRASTGTIHSQSPSVFPPPPSSGHKSQIPGASVGVSYDIHNRPISVNTFGSVMPDVTSEVDLATTSETDVEDRNRNKNYEPNILERALERTICYHPRYNKKPTKVNIVLMCLMTIFSNAGILIASPIYTTSMRRAGGDEMVVLLSLAAVMPLPLVFLSLLLRHTYDKTITLRPSASTVLYVVLGVCFALRYNIGVFASLPSHTHQDLQPAISAAGIPFIIVVSWCILKKGISFRRLACCAAALAGVFVCVEPRIWSVEGSSGDDLFPHDTLVSKICWPAIFGASFFPWAIFVAASEREIKKNVIHSFSLATSGILSGCVFIVALFGTDFIPWYGNVDNLADFWDKLEEGFLCNFSYKPRCENCLIKLVALSSSIVCHSIFSLLLVSATEGSVFTTLVSAMSAPVVAGFWSLFDYDYSTDTIKWHPTWSHSVAFTIASFCLVFPATIAYTIFYVKDMKAKNREKKGYSDVSSSEYDWEWD
ncbi:hypothetical protein ElyMa_003118600 [Elysia marginata]|uniref:EamA domain-containing protein n=1 Tax=Elysia marginata TaxID=1093978 RepID=A0AAV4IR99_9GAST|nr:hypothetical protein ElyMa_003118600 [Elysia marginata]